MKRRIRAIWRTARRPLRALWRWARKPRDRERRYRRWRELEKWANRKRKQAPPKTAKRASWAERRDEYHKRVRANKPKDPAPSVVTRAEWGARPPKARYSLASTSNGVFIHHTVSLAPSTVAAGKAEMRNLQRFHMDSRGWNDIAYSYLVDRAGNVYVGRGEGVVGGHTEGYNSTSHAICAMGNYETDYPTQAMLDAIRWVRREVLDAGSQPLRPHSAVNQTACPGIHLRSRLGGL